jgi:hypothetical protein
VQTIDNLHLRFLWPPALLRLAKKSHKSIETSKRLRYIKTMEQRKPGNEMANPGINIKEARKLWEADAIESVAVHWTGAEYWLAVRDRRGTVHSVLTAKGDRRDFHSLDTAAGVVRDIGADTFAVHL